MPESQSEIERLAPSTQAKLRSTQILTSLPQIVSELIQNSLDAKPSQIHVGLDCKEWMCWVQDDGHGISKEDLEKLGQGEDGGRYKTSKTYLLNSSNLNPVPTFGFRGEALASAADMSCLEICSRTTKSRNTWSIILKGGKSLYIGPAVRWKRERSGTVVCIRDAFYNLPVRRLSHLSPARTWDLVRQELETYSLVFPSVAFILEDLSHAQNASHRKERIVRIPKSHSTLARFRHLFGHALTEHIEEFDTSSDSMKIQGFISLIGSSSKMYQFLFINHHLISNCDLHRVIDSLFMSSSFSKNALDEDGEKGLPRSTARRSPRKIEKKPIYVINISTPPEDVDNCIDPTKSVVHLRNKDSIVSFLSSVLQRFLVKHGFLFPKESLMQPRGSSPSPRKRKKSERHQFDDSGYAESTSIGEMSTWPLEDEHHMPVPDLSTTFYTSPDAPSEEIMWTDASTGERFFIDSRTGHSYRQSEYLPEHVETTTLSREGRRTFTLPKIDSLVPTKRDSEVGAGLIPAWLEHAFKKNQAYTLTESRIPSVKSSHSHIAPASGHFPDKHGCHISQKLGVGHDNSTLRFTREDLRCAEIISQVDKKFIACRITKRSCREPYPDSPILVLVDQHAADERVRVERFLKDLCLGFLHSQDQTDNNSASKYVFTRELIPSRPVLLTQHEALTISHSQAIQETFQKWGVRFAELWKVISGSDGASESGSNNGYLQLYVSAIPEIVGDKLLQGDELRDFIKGFLSQIQHGELLLEFPLDFPSEKDQTGEDLDEYLWLKAVRKCPKGLLDLVNSKACRGAIMFNDSLSVPQCAKLVKQLSETAFPFQCAHGRPSLVPLVDTGTLLTLTNKRKRPQNDWERLKTIEK
ncbi:hypothetical protein BYT27DRAFT_7159313 [Phlegmacium glaucopus]|nr:hypothetical protein BYT27DRAFT_7159313 [Phlegmacium glaucopus]